MQWPCSRFLRLQRVLSSNNRNRTVYAGQHPERPSFDLLSSRGEDGKGMLRMGGDRAFHDYLNISNPARSHSHKFVCSFSSQLNARALELMFLPQLNVWEQRTLLTKDVLLAWKKKILSRHYYSQEKPNISNFILLHHYQDEIDFNTVQINPLDQSDDAIMTTRHSIKMCWVVKPLRPKNFTLSRDMSQASIGQWLYLSQGPQEISWSFRIHNPIHFNSQRGPSEI